MGEGAGNRRAGVYPKEKTHKKRTNALHTDIDPRTQNLIPPIYTPYQEAGSGPFPRTTEGMRE